MNSGGELTDNQQAPPLLASPRARLFYCLANLFLGLFDVGLNLLTALVDNFDHGFLLFYHLFHLVEKVGKFDDSLFDALDFVVPGLNLAEGGSGFTTAITAEELYNVSSNALMFSEVRFKTKKNVQLARKSALPGCRCRPPQPPALTHLA